MNSACSPRASRVVQRMLATNAGITASRCSCPLDALAKRTRLFASQGHVVVSEAGVLRRTGRKLKLQGVTGITSFADEVEIALQAPMLSCFEHDFQPCCPSMFTQASADNILSHALLKQQGYQIDFAEGSDGDPTFGGTIITPDGEKINM
eukprot:2886377-Rhodomonas_salina.1